MSEKMFRPTSEDMEVLIEVLQSAWDIHKDDPIGSRLIHNIAVNLGVKTSPVGTKWAELNMDRFMAAIKTPPSSSGRDS